MESTNDGFVLAQADLEMRGPGDLFGTAQSGYDLPLRVAALGDTRTLERAREAAEALLATDPHLMKERAHRPPRPPRRLLVPLGGRGRQELDEC